MRVLSLVHESDAGSGVFGAEVVRLGHEFEEWRPSRDPLPRPLSEYGAIIAFGGGMHADQEDEHPWLRRVLDLLREALDREVPTLGICLGGQVLARVAGGDVGPATRAEWGWDAVELTPNGSADPVFAGLGPTLEVFQWHSYRFELPPGAVALARSPVCLQAFRAGRAAWGLQWHPEVTAETAMVWGERFPPRPNDVPVQIDVDALRQQIAERIGRTNDEGRDLCARFLRVAQELGARRR
jgi:GMP synthase-like glutamine amidotransferase